MRLKNPGFTWKRNLGRSTGSNSYMSLTVEKQIEILDAYPEKFGASVRRGGGDLKARTLTTFQVNVGRVCNQACHHCHVDASPIRTENMSREVAEKCAAIIRDVDEIETVDITGGAPEMNPQFRYLVETAHAAGKHVIDRCNLTILEEPGYEYLYDFLKDNKVEIIASLPHYAADRTDRQRGKGVFDKSVIALRKLNELGYGVEGGLPLNLVYNPSGFFLSSGQEVLEREFKGRLREDFGIEFNSLYCINNMPISRFLQSLMMREQYEDYMETLVTAYNPATVEGLMCKHQISIGYLGDVYDCDFNQMLEIKAKPIAHIDDFDLEQWKTRDIMVSAHCYGCTAGAGSSCGGEIGA